MYAFESLVPNLEAVILEVMTWISFFFKHWKNLNSCEFL